MSVFRTHHRKCEGCGNLFTPKTLQGNRETQQWKCDECKGKPAVGCVPFNGPTDSASFHIKAFGGRMASERRVKGGGRPRGFT